MKTIRVLLTAFFAFGLLLFPLAVQAQPDIPSGAEVTSATLSVAVRGTNTESVTLHRVTSPWAENTVTWNNFGGFSDTVIDTITPNSLGWKSFDVTEVVQGWVNESYPNYGFLMKASGEELAGYTSSEFEDASRRPKLEVCYIAANDPETCVTIQRLGSQAEDVFDSVIWEFTPDTNYGGQTSLFTGEPKSREKRSLIYFDFNVVKLPGVEIVKKTNGAVASDPNGDDVPRLSPGDPVTWTYEITNTGYVSVPRESVVVTDDQGVMPVFHQVLSGDEDTLFEPGEVWEYRATGTALDLRNAPVDVKTQPNSCTGNGETARNAYINQGMVTIPGDSDTAQSSYCNPPKPGVEIVKYTNGEDANDPDGTDVPRLSPGEAVTWTYLVKNIGEVAVLAESVVVTDNQVDANPVFSAEQLGDGDTLFEPGEEWLYIATSEAANLDTPPAGMIVENNTCTANGTENPRNAYVNQGMVTIPGDDDMDLSSYCNPEKELYKYYLPILESGIIIDLCTEDAPCGWSAVVGYEDLPLASGQNDFDYNDWILDISITQNAVDVDGSFTWIKFNMLPGARGAAFNHEFHIAVPAGTFTAGGRAIVTVKDGSGNVVETRSTPFTPSQKLDVVIFENTGDVFPTMMNTNETIPAQTPRRTAELLLDFDGPSKNNVSGLFYNPYIRVLNYGTGNIIDFDVPSDPDTRDPRLLFVPDLDYFWPEERVRLDRVYGPHVRYVPSDPKFFQFDDEWWKTPNNCKWGDGVRCSTLTSTALETLLKR